jgi:pilus assembly protein CpaB
MQGTLVKQPVADRRMMLLALILAAVAAGLIVAFLASRSSGGTTAAPPVPMTLVVVTAKEVPAGKPLEASDLALKSLPASAVVVGAYTDRADAIGMTTRYPLAQGEQVAAPRLVSPQKNQALSFQIPTGKRGFTIAVSVTNTPASVLVAGDFVDVIFSATLATIDVPGAIPTPSALTEARREEQADPKNYNGVITLIQNVQVLSVERAYVAEGVYEPSTRGEVGDSKEAKEVKHVTIAVSPEQAQLLWLAVQQGKLSLSLRAFGDDSIVEVAPVTEPLKLR